MSGLAGKEVCRRGCIRGRLDGCCEEFEGAEVREGLFLGFEAGKAMATGGGEDIL